MASVDEVRAAAKAGIHAVRNGRSDQAGVHFTQALNLTEELTDARVRRDEVSDLAILFDQCGFPDLSLMAAEEAVQLDEELGLDDVRAMDVLNVGIAQIGLGNEAEAEQSYREARDLFLARNEFANAASANTNLASIAAMHDKNVEAIALLKTSLAYLAKDPLDDTEMQTRVRLLQALEETNGDVELAAGNAEKLYANFFDQIPQEQERVRELLQKAVGRYLSQHRELDAASWKAEHFPSL